MSVFLQGLNDRIRNETIKEFFENKGRSKGGPVTSVERLSPATAVVKFEQRQG